MRRKREWTIHLAELAELLGAKIASAGDGDEALELRGLNTLEFAEVQEVSFLGSADYWERARASRAGALIVGPGMTVDGARCLVVENVWKAVLKLFDRWYPDERKAPGVHASAIVEPGAEVAPSASIGPLAVVEAGARIGADAEVGAHCFIGRDACIGERTILHPGVRVLERVRVGCDCVLHCGVALGSDGYSYEVLDERITKIPQVGTVVVGNDVEIGANTCIDRAFMHETRIGDGTKIDNLVHIAHNVQVGRSSGLLAHTGVAGSTVIGDGVLIGGHVAIRNNITIGDGAFVVSGSGVKDDIPPGGKVFGLPAQSLGDYGRQAAALKRLPAAIRTLRAMEKKASGS